MTRLNEALACAAVLTAVAGCPTPADRDAAAVDAGQHDSAVAADHAGDASSHIDGSSIADSQTGVDIHTSVDSGNVDAGSALPGQIFPPGAFMNQDISSAALDPSSTAITQWLADNGGWGNSNFQVDISFEVMRAVSDTPYIPLTVANDYWTPDCDEMDFPLPAGGRIEGEAGYQCTSGGDCHLLVIDDRVSRLYELYIADYTSNVLSTTCEAVWDLTRVYPPEGRGEQCTSADAAGLPITALLFNADEVAAGAINHAIRFILPNPRMRAGVYVHPANHAGGPAASDPMAPPYGTRWRLKAGFDGSAYTAAAQVVIAALKKYGMVLSDGGNIALTAQADTFTTAKWADLGFDSHSLYGIVPTDFEVVATDPPIDLTYDCVRTPESW